MKAVADLAEAACAAALTLLILPIVALAAVADAFLGLIDAQFEDADRRVRRLAR